MKRLAFLLALAPLVLLAACTPAEEEMAEQELDTLQTEAVGEMQDWRMGIDSSLADIDEGIDSLEVHAEEAGAEAEDELSSTIADLRERRDSLQQDLQQLEAAGDANFEDLRSDIEMELDELETDLEDARRRYLEENAGTQPS